MDVAATLLAEKILLEYQARTSCTVVLVTHSLTQARRVAGQVFFLQNGHLVEQGTAEQVLLHPRCADTRAFLDFYALCSQQSSENGMFSTKAGTVGTNALDSGNGS